MIERVLAQCYKELAQFKRDRLTLALAFILPFMTLIIYGFAIRLEAKNIPLFVQDLDNTPLSRSYIERLYATNQFIPITEINLAPNLEKNPQAIIDQGIARVAVIIPPDFTRQIKEGSTSDVQVIIDGSDVNNARVIKNSIQGTTLRFLQDSKLQSIPQKILSRLRIWFNPGRKESLYIVPGLYGLILWIFPSLLSAIAMVREKSQGTILQIYASALTASEWILGKTIAYLTIAVAEALLMMISGYFIWGVGIRNDPSPLILSTLAFLTDAILFGLMIGSLAANQSAAIQAVALLGFLSAFLLSGFIYPLTNIPFPLSLVSYIVPARYYMAISRDAFVRGTGWPGVWLYFVMLIILGFLIFQRARLGLKKMQLSRVC